MRQNNKEKPFFTKIITSKFQLHESRAPTSMVNGGNSVRRNDHHIEPESSLLLHFRPIPDEPVRGTRTIDNNDDEITIVTYKCEVGSEAVSPSPSLLIRSAEESSATTATTAMTETNVNLQSQRRLALPPHLNNVTIHSDHYFSLIPCPCLCSNCAST